MVHWAAALLLAVGVLIVTRPAAASVYERPAAPNAILGVSTACSSESLNVTVRMRVPFRGVVYSRGFPLECSTARDQHRKLIDFLRQREQEQGDVSNQVPLQPSREVTLSLPAAECGIRVVPSKDGEGLWLQTSVIVQLDRHLQQAADQTRTASCYLPSKESSSSLLLQPLQQHRTGRQHGDIPSVDFGEAAVPTSSSSSSSSSPQQNLQRARAVMEILSTSGRGVSGTRAGGPRDPGVLAVGEEAALIVTSHLPAGVGSRVTDCFAHDGAGESMERLSDGRGCPTDRLILPQLAEVPASTTSAAALRRRRRRGLGPGAVLSTHVSAAKFAAFKFPDRSRLHLRCQLQLCRGVCPQDSCLPDKVNVTRQERKARKGERGEVLGRLQVFNSVEVLAPGIEVDDRLRLDELMAANGGPSAHATHPLRREDLLPVPAQDGPGAGYAGLHPAVRGSGGPLHAPVRASHSSTSAAAAHGTPVVLPPPALPAPSRLPGLRVQRQPRLIGVPRGEERPGARPGFVRHAIAETQPEVDS